MSEEIKKIENTTEETQMEPVQEETAQAESASVEIPEMTAETEHTEETEAEHAEEPTKGRFRKSRLTAILVALCILATISVGTMAYFRVEDTSYNVITTGGVAMELVETQMDEEGNISEFPGKVENVLPGHTVSKIVSIKNTGNEENGKANDIYVRMKLETEIIAENKTDKLDASNVVLDIDTEHWMVNDPDDGYYYYKEALGPDEITQPLLKNVTLKWGMGNEYMNSTITISVRAEGVQAKNNGDSVMEAEGWPEVNP